jgi:small-conductance mechanosensitive channel
MNSEPPSIGELSRRLNEVHNSIQQLVSQDLYVAEQRAGLRRFTKIERDIDALRRRLDEDLKTVAVRLDLREREHGSNWRMGVYFGFIPTALLLISLLVQVWLTVQENH